jgi:hypothetical protein
MTLSGRSPPWRGRRGSPSGKSHSGDRIQGRSKESDASGASEYTASRGTGTFYGSVSRHPPSGAGQERRLQLTTTPIATHAINDGSTRVIRVPSPGPFPALGRAIMAQRDAGSGCVDGSSWSAAIGRRSTSLWARVSRPIREWHSPRPTPVRAARTAVGRPCRLNLTAPPPTSRPELPMGSQGSRPVARPSAP